MSLLISGSVVTETLFSIPGMGQLLTQAVLNRDYPMVQGGLLLVTAFLVLINIGVDVCYSLLDPRVRYDGVIARRGRQLELDADIPDRASASRVGDAEAPAAPPAVPLRARPVRHRPAGGGSRAVDRAGRPDQAGDALQIPPARRRLRVRHGQFRPQPLVARDLGRAAFRHHRLRRSSPSTRSSAR